LLDILGGAVLIYSETAREQFGVDARVEVTGKYTTEWRTRWKYSMIIDCLREQKCMET